MGKLCTLNELAALVQGQVVGDGDLQVSGLNGIDQAGDDEITFVTSVKAAAGLRKSRAAACIIPFDLDDPGIPHIRAENPECAAAIIHSYFLAQPFVAHGIHPSAHIGRDCRIDEKVSLGPQVVVGERVRIAARVTIHPGAVIGNDSVIGEDTIIYPNVTIA
ncbi:MAG TPA: UDP-3-O-(3-hydroxymyristoyl)glucosamine N-acyltransferase, partial [Desulfobacteraceae bacterium]|nr:UDP-3-O-(3-hydroxymyristoyl)glucosamine N-acyltransferase [Desulfobacteraceae bacterium]